MTALNQTPGEMAVRLSRVLDTDYLVEFESAPAGWLAKNGEPRKRDWRAYYLSRIDLKTGEPDKRQRVESVSSIKDAILPKDGLPPWAERQGIYGALQALRTGLIDLDTDDEWAVQVIRRNGLGADGAKDRAADRGINVHKILERFMETGRAPNPADHPEPHRPFIRGLVKWLLWANPEPIAVELLVADPERGYAGRLDLLAHLNGSKRLSLVDLKTQANGAIYDSAHVQVQLYRQAEDRFGEHMIDNSQIVVVDANGGFREMELLADETLAAHALDYYALIKRLSAECESQNRLIRKVLEEAA